jgi:IclR helix-turn-helix domain
MTGRTDESAQVRVEDAVAIGLDEVSAGRWSNGRAQFEQGVALCAAREAGKRKMPEFAPFESPANHPDPRFSQSLERGMTILTLFTDDAPTWGIAEIADALNESRSTVHRYCLTLVRIGYITQEGVAARKYMRVIFPLTDPLEIVAGAIDKFVEAVVAAEPWKGLNDVSEEELARWRGAALAKTAKALGMKYAPAEDSVVAAGS